MYLLVTIICVHVAVFMVLPQVVELNVTDIEASFVFSSVSTLVLFLFGVRHGAAMEIYDGTL